MNGSNPIEKFQKRESKGEDYATKGRKLNKRDRAKGRADKRAQGEDE